MPSPRAILAISVALSLTSSIVVAKLWVWPRLRTMDRNAALTALVAPHMFLRFIGLSFLVPGVVSTALGHAFAIPAAYGDLVTGILAIVATVALSQRVPWADGATWLFNLVGTADLLFAFLQGARAGLDPGALGAAYFIVTAIVPPLVVGHALTFRILASRPVPVLRPA
jgi:hypothetical protein